MAAIDWYFDFISPFSYLQSERLDRWAPAQVRPRPVLFAGLLAHWGHKGPAEIGSKRRFTYRQVQWQAERAGIPLRFPPRHPFNPLKALRLAIALGSGLEVVHTIFRHLWREGDDIDTAEGWGRLVARLGVEDADARIAQAAVKDELRRNGEAAIAAGVFGVPTAVVDGELFWGFDATEMVADYLRDPARFRTGELARVADLPVGVERPR